MSKTMAKYMYAALMREATAAKKAQQLFWVCKPEQIPSWGSGAMCDNMVDSLKALAPHTRARYTAKGDGVPLSMGSAYLNGDQLKEVLRQEYRAPVPKKDGLSATIDKSLAVLRLLRDPSHRLPAACASSAASHGVRVEANSLHLDHEEGHLFTYRVRLENFGDRPVALVGRHFIFKESAGGTVEVPKGSPGVVGLLPTIQPGECFVYASGCRMERDGGTMKGSFQMRFADEGDKEPELFDAEIAPLRLLAPASKPRKTKKTRKPAA